ncbi:MAG: hypothetical protein GY949_17875 [Gammaproteobacteria bacterium]|nr:hypothetical protein [Gammaproteobacteria bacterium]
MRNVAALLIAAVLAAGCAASPSTPDDPSGEMVSNSESEGVICRRDSQVGSRLGRTVCTTREQRERMAEEAREALQGAQQSGPTSGGVEPAGVGSL